MLDNLTDPDLLPHYCCHLDPERGSYATQTDIDAELERGERHLAD
jgi:hypothetical protein